MFKATLKKPKDKASSDFNNILEDLSKQEFQHCDVGTVNN